jgi:hypothetical protein
MADGFGAAAAKLAGAGLAIGGIAAWLVSQGNPGNMGLCIACFLRDTAGAFGGAPLNMGAVAYIRPEILGLVLGAAAAAMVSREFRPRGGAAFIRRFAIGFAFMMAALVFLGCTVKDVPSVKIIKGIDDEAGTLGEGCCILSARGNRHGIDIDLRIELEQFVTGRAGFLPSDILVPVEYLPVHVRQVNPVRINDGDIANTCSSEVDSNGAAKTPCSRDNNMC